MNLLRYRFFHVWRVFLVAVVVQVTSLVCAAASEPSKPMPERIPSAVDLQENCGADTYGGSGNHASSRYYGNPDFFRLRSDDRLTIIGQYRTYQQTSEWSCGPAAALTVLWHVGIRHLTEGDIAAAMTTHVDSATRGARPGSAVKAEDFGTTVGEMYAFFAGLPQIRIVESSYVDAPDSAKLISLADELHPPSERGNLPKTFCLMSLYTAVNEPNATDFVAQASASFFVTWLTGHLKANRPILVEWSDWGGHWVAIIGYDNMGTSAVDDDILIFADPYDSSDNWQDGYSYFPLVRWFTMWSDTRVARKPFQLQPYIIVEKR